MIGELRLLRLGVSVDSIQESNAETYKKLRNKDLTEKSSIFDPVNSWSTQNKIIKRLLTRRATIYDIQWKREREIAFKLKLKKTMDFAQEISELCGMTMVVSYLAKATLTKILKLKTFYY